MTSNLGYLGSQLYEKGFILLKLILKNVRLKGIVNCESLLEEGKHIYPLSGNRDGC